MSILLELFKKDLILTIYTQISKNVDIISRQEW